MRDVEPLAQILNLDVQWPYLGETCEGSGAEPHWRALSSPTLLAEVLTIRNATLVKISQYVQCGSICL